jgi:hypothetical protein
MKMKIPEVGANKVGEAPNPHKVHSSSGGFSRSRPHNLLSQTLAFSLSKANEQAPPKKGELGLPI